MQKTNNPSNKSLLITGVLTIILGIILGILTIILNLNKYLNDINTYSEENKTAVEIAIQENDDNYNKYVEEIKELNQTKQLYQKELSDISKTSNNSAKYLELENEISSINIRLEELEQLKYSSLTEKNNLRNKYNEILSTLKEKENPKKIIKCYLVGVAIILVTINTGAYFIHLSFQPDTDDIILKNQLKIDKEREAKLLNLIENSNNNLKSSATSNISNNSSKNVNKPKNKNTNYKKENNSKSKSSKNTAK